MQGTGTRRVVVLDTGYDSYAGEREAAARVGAVLELFDGDMHDREGRIGFAQGAAGVYVRWTVVDAGFLDAAPSVKAVLRYGVGYDNVDLEAASARGVRVANAQGYANHSVSDHALALMPPSAILVNTARGPIVDEDALLEALKAERLFAAGLDVFCDEPPSGNRDELLAHPHVVPTGHYAWFSTALAISSVRQ